MATETFAVATGADDGLVISLSEATYPPAVDAAYTGDATFAAARGLNGGLYTIANGLLRWDTSGLPDNAIIDSALLRVWVDTLGDADSRHLVADGYTAWPIDVADYSAAAQTGALDVAISTLTAGAYNDLTLTGLGSISVSGYTGLRLHVSGGQPTGQNWVTMAAYENVDGHNPPQLLVTYSIPIDVVDTGAGTDAASVFATLATLADTGMGVDGISALVTMLLADVGAGVDEAAVLAALVALSDMGSGLDATTMAASASVSDTGSGLDAILDVLCIHVYIRTDGTIDPLGVILLRGGREDMLPAPREYTETIPGRPGEVDFGADVGPRGLELRAASHGDLTATQKTALKRYVAGWLRPSLGVFNIAWEADPDRYLAVRVAGAIQPEEYASWLQFTIPLKATQPMYLGSMLQMLIGSGTALCDGNLETPATVTIRGPVTNPSVTVAGLTFTWAGTVGANDSLVVDGDRSTVTFNGVNSLSGFRGDFPALQPGDNTVTAASAGTTTVTWRDRWI